DAASTAALASSTLALATEVILFSVAGSITSKRAPSDALRHLPPIHRSVGTFARRFSYMRHLLDFETFCWRISLSANRVHFAGICRSEEHTSELQSHL